MRSYTGVLLLGSKGAKRGFLLSLKWVETTKTSKKEALDSLGGRKGMVDSIATSLLVTKEEKEESMMIGKEEESVKEQKEIMAKRNKRISVIFHRVLEKPA